MSSAEPFHKLFNQGMIQAYAYTDERGVYVPAAEVEERDGAYFYEGEQVEREHGKMGKSLKNTVTPTRSARSTARTPCACTRWRWARWTSPVRGTPGPWSASTGCCSARAQHRGRGDGRGDGRRRRLAEDTLRALHKAIDGAGSDLTGLRFNTAIAKITELNNALTKAGRPLERSVAEALVLLVAPLAPHIAEELWHRLGHSESVVHQDFPVADPAYVVDESVRAWCRSRARSRRGWRCRRDLGGGAGAAGRDR
ncbi:leucine--tRNA ligase [Streptomyces avidinii]